MAAVEYGHRLETEHECLSPWIDPPTSTPCILSPDPSGHACEHLLTVLAHLPGASIYAHQSSCVMPSVAKTIEILAEGDTIEEATENAYEHAAQSVDDIRHIYVDDYRALVENGEIDRYRVDAKVTFLVHQREA